MTNNLENIKSRLEDVFNRNSPDLFFHVQLIQRKKEVPEINKNSNVIKSYAVKNMEYLENKLESEIIPICKLLNARAMINLNPKSFKRVTHAMLRKLSGYIEDDFYEGAITKVFDSCASSTSIEKLGIDKYWIIDIDTKDEEVLRKAQSIVNLCEPIVPGYNKIKGMLSTKNGYHLFTTPFNVQSFNKFKDDEQNKLVDVEIKKDCLTNLFIA